MLQTSDFKFFFNIFLFCMRKVGFIVKGLFPARRQMMFTLDESRPHLSALTFKM